MFPRFPVNAYLSLVLVSLLAIYISESNAEAATHRLRRQSSNKKPLKGGVCELPQPINNGKMRPSENRCPKDDTKPACLMLPGAFVPEDWVLYYECDSGYVLNTTKTIAVCYNNSWIPPLSVCNKLCPPLRSHSLDLNCTFRGTKVSCDQKMRPGTVATQACKDFYSPAFEPESSQIKCLNSGVWDYPLSYCTPDDICKQDGDTLWACKKIAHCPKAQEGLKNRIIPETCYVSEKDPYICCEPQTIDDRVMTSPPQPEERKSIQMCRKYAESVFVSLPETDGGGEEKIDTCNLIEPVNAPVPKKSDDAPEYSSNIQQREFPHIAVIGYGDKGYRRPDFRCAGSLISERYVLSVARCSETPIGPAAWVRLGDYNINSAKDEDVGDSKAIIYDIAEHINHPDYKKPSDPNDFKYNDIALFRLSTSVKFNEFIRPICLHAGDQFARSFALTTGWGPVEPGGRPSDILQKVNQTIIGDKECSDDYKFHGVQTDGLNTTLLMCAALVDGRHTCMSVTGSPLQIRLQNPYCMYSLAGVYSFGRACFVKSPGVYNRVSYYLDWIEKTVWP